MTKSKVLFIIGSLDSGGVSKSLVNTLNAIDYSRYNVDLLVMSGSHGVFGQYLPQDVRVIINNQICNALHGFKGIMAFIKDLKIRLAVMSVVRMILSLFNKARSGYLLSRMFPSLDAKYDMIVDYNGQHQLYYMVDRLCGKKKVTFFHSDYEKWPYYKSMDKKYYTKVDAIFTISPQCVESLKRNFPEVAEKVQLFENISSPSVIIQMANEEIDETNWHGQVLLTIGHIWKNKGIDLAIDAARVLKQKRIDFTWLFIGKIAEPKWLHVVNKYGLQDSMIFLGIKQNPYPYLKQCDIYVHPSRFEGKSIALDEAKILCKPIVVTNFSTVYDQFENGLNATICEMNGESLASGIELLIKDNAIANKYVEYLISQVKDNSSEINKLLKHLNSNG